MGSSGHLTARPLEPSEPLAHCMNDWIMELDWGFTIIMALTLGLAPFAPPHIVEKIGMLSRGELVRPIDIFDFLMHGTPWALLIWKVVLTMMTKGSVTA